MTENSGSTRSPDYFDFEIVEVSHLHLPPGRALAPSRLRLQGEVHKVRCERRHLQCVSTLDPMHQEHKGALDKAQFR